MAPRVFISYSHDNDEHRARVLALAQRLRDEGVDAHLDRFTEDPTPQWMVDQVHESDFVLAVCTPIYRLRFEQNEARDRGRGVTWEGKLITNLLYERRERPIVLPVLFDVAGADHVPTVLRDNTRHYQLDSDYDRLYRRLTDQPEVMPHPIGSIRPLARMEVASDGTLARRPLAHGISWFDYLQAAARASAPRVEKITPLEARVELLVLPWADPMARRSVERRAAEVAPVAQVIREQRRLVLLGEPGSGKSTALFAALHELASEALADAGEPRIPLLVDLAEFRAGGPRVLEELIARRVATLLQKPDAAIRSDEIHAALRAGRFLVMLDGLNEVSAPVRPLCVAAIHAFAAAYPGIDLVISSRRFGYAGELPFQTVELLDLSLERLPVFVTRLVGDEGEIAAAMMQSLDREMRRLALTPLFLHMMTWVYVQDRALPANRAALIGEYVKLLLRRYAAVRGGHGESIDEPRLLDGLGRLALLMKERSLRLSRAEASVALGDEQILAESLECGLLHGDGKQVWFWHHAFQEYFCVRGLAQAWSGDGPLVRRFFATESWWETLSMTAGLLEGEERRAFLERCEHTDPHLTAMALNHAREGTGDIGERLVRRALKLDRLVRPLSSFLRFETTLWIITAVIVLDGLTFEIGRGVELFHTIHSRLSVPYVPEKNSATVINMACLFVISLLFSRFIDWLLLARFQPAILALQQLGTEAARDALLSIHRACQRTKNLHPSYVSLVVRSVMARFNTDEELLANLDSGRNLFFTLAVLGKHGSAATVAPLADWVEKNRASEDGETALQSLDEIVGREPNDEALATVARVAETTMAHSDADLDARRAAHKILCERYGRALPPPRVTLRDRLRLLKRNPGHMVAFVILAGLGLALFFGPPDPARPAVRRGRESWTAAAYAWMVFVGVGNIVLYWLVYRLGEWVVERKIRRARSKVW